MSIDIEPEFRDSLVAVANNPLKAITFGVMSGGPDEFYGKARIYNKLMAFQLPDPEWDFGRTLPFGYLGTFAKFGLTLPSTSDATGARGYIIQRSCIGEAVTGIVLKFQEENPSIPLSILFGPSYYPKSLEAKRNKLEIGDRAPVTRFKLLWELATLPAKVKVADLVRDVDGQARVGTHLVSLANIGVVNYETAPHNESICYFRLNDDLTKHDFVPLHSHPRLSNEVYRLLLTKGIGDFDYIALWNALGNESSEFDNNKRGVLAMMMKLFVKQGIVSQVSEFSGDEQTHAWVSNYQRELISPMIDNLDRVNSHEPEAIKDGRTYLRCLLENSARVRELIFLAKAGSPYAPGERDILNDVYQSVIAYPGISTSQIRDRIADKAGYSIHSQTVSIRLDALSSENKVSSRNRKDVVYWYPN